MKIKCNDFKSSLHFLQLFTLLLQLFTLHVCILTWWQNRHVYNLQLPMWHTALLFTTLLRKVT